MHSVRHIFLTGEKKVGKSTLWQKVLARAPVSVAGFQTLEYLVGETFRGYRLHSLGKSHPQYGNDVPISIFLRPKFHIAVSEVFDSYGADVLHMALADGGCILMDELGTFEQNSPLFQAAVRDCLNGNCHVLGVLQKADSPFISEILNREDVQMFTVTRENREMLAEEILALIHHFE